MAAMPTADRSGHAGFELAWLPFLNTFRTMCLAPETEFRLVIEEIRKMRLAA